MNTLVWSKLDEKITKVGFRKIISKTYRMPDNTEAIFDVVEGGESACVLALTKENKVILTEQFRPGPEKLLREIPGGAIDSGESPLEAIQRELKEETGYSGKLEYLGKTYRSAYSTGIKHFFLAKDCIKEAEPTKEEGEFIAVKEIEMNEFLQIVKSGDLTDLDGALLALNALRSS
ncbi:NUDIX hydrolase [candidate division WWE3 bacterium]|uniref:NUDIX hydrolase n=1 Tax=candidate division WWE3 bacterium TaxID=2053526 RepID=A0A7X9E6E0_UNCKA|nr:NUDIX hydrolase [candidate division WWE3 bacterium]